jgi:hypothetical protein
MPLPRSAYGSLPAALTLDSSSGWTDNKHAAENDLDPHMTAARLASLGRITGYDVEFDDLGTASKRGVVIDADSEVDLFRSSTAAARFLALELSEFRRFAGKRLQYGATLDHVGYFAVPSIGGAKGVRGRLHVGGLTFWETGVEFRAGAVAANVGLGRTDDRNVDAEVSRLALKLKQRIDGVLAGRVLTLLEADVELRASKASAAGRVSLTRSIFHGPRGAAVMREAIVSSLPASERRAVKLGALSTFRVSAGDAAFAVTATLTGRGVPFDFVTCAVQRGPVVETLQLLSLPRQRIPRSATARLALTAAARIDQALRG